MRQVSYVNKIRQLDGLLDTGDLTAWEERFVRDMVSYVAHLQSTERLTPRQLETIDRIWETHFA